MFKYPFFSMCMLLISLLLPATIYAQSSDISGTVDDSDGCVQLLGGWSPGDIIRFQVTTTGSYTFTHGSHTWGASMWFYLYAGSYNPTDVYNQPSYIGRGNSVGMSVTSTFTSGTTYIIATNNSQPGLGSQAACVGRASTTGGTYTVNVNGSGVVCISSCSTSTRSDSDENPCPVFYDGRINTCDTFNSVVLYGQADENDNWRLEVYAADGDGLLLVIPASVIATVPICPEANTLIFSDRATHISLYRLTERPNNTCPFQLNAPATESGKTYVIIFDELYPNTYYESHEEIIGH